MRRRRSKKRRELFYRIRAAHRSQPGYQELLEEESRRKTEIFREISSARGENHKLVVASIDRTWQGRLSRLLDRLAYPVFEFFKAHLILPFVVAYVLGLAASPAVAVAALLLYILACTVPHGLAAGLWSWQQSRHKGMAAELESQAYRGEANLNREMKEALRQNYDEFSGYPPDWHERRQRVFHRDKFKCQNCGETFPSTKLHAHHVMAIEHGGSSELGNLETLCSRCHREHHKHVEDID